MPSEGATGVDVVNVVIAGVSALFTGVAAWAAVAANRKAKAANDTATAADAKSAEALAKASEAFTRAAEAQASSALSAQASVELEMRNGIAIAWNKVLELRHDRRGHELRAKNRLTAAEKAELETIDAMVNSTLMTWYNAYEAACAKYLDGKVDQERFRKDYEREVRQLVDDALRESGLVDATSPYKATLAVYREWFDREVKRIVA